MRLGAPVYHWKTAREWAMAHVEKGYGAAYWPLADDVRAQDAADFVCAAADHDLVIAEVGIWNNLLDPDPARRAANFDQAVRRLETAERVGARCCVNISGSRSAIWDGPHPENLTDATFEMVVDTTRRLIDAVKPARTRYTLEPMPWMVPHDEFSMRRILDAVDRPAFGVHADMVNLINSYDKYIATGDLTRRFFGAFGHIIRSVHLKDTRIDPNRLTLHIDEAAPGEGDFDYPALIDCCAACAPDLPMMIEHLADEADYDRAARNIRAIADAKGLSFIESIRR
ncbi:MAG: sugar phosphate isomerase/epimerase family protein [Christensenellales bacterium]|jgi:sugar phosphate isomerase/epimerase